MTELMLCITMVPVRSPGSLVEQLQVIEITITSVEKGPSLRDLLPDMYTTKLDRPIV